MSEILTKLNEAIQKNLKPATLPVAVKMAAEGEVIGQRAKRPRDDSGNRLAACQGVNIARTFGWTLVFDRQDHACPLASVAAGHIEPDEFLRGAVSDLYQDDAEAARKMESGYPLHPPGTVKEIWMSALERCGFDPDLVIVYGTPAQILVLIHAANYGHGPGIGSTSTGRFGCASWIAGAVRSSQCEYMIPCSGERVFAGTQDHEMSFLIPRPRFGSVTHGLEVMRKKGTYRYPVPNLSLFSTPKLPEKYLALDKDLENDGQ
ncbi:MAG: DUF169 domain-containing protein [bacterium]|nr:DUF169 domain-containing protein [bacterium]